MFGEYVNALPGRAPRMPDRRITLERRCHGLAIDAA
jgi:hypothetical protein